MVLRKHHYRSFPVELNRVVSLLIASFGLVLSAHQHHIRKSIERSKALLLTGDLPVGEVCAAVGFEDQSYFTRVFRRITGTLPRAYRERMTRGNGKENHRAAACGPDKEETL